MGRSDGFNVYLKDMTGAGHETLMQARNQVLAAAGANAKLSGTRLNGQEDTPQFSVLIDQEKTSALWVDLATINTTLSTAWGGNYVNDFIDRGRVKKVYLQSAPEFRMQPENLGC